MKMKNENALEKRSSPCDYIFLIKMKNALLESAAPPGNS
jgi:hypothetical protein